MEETKVTTLKENTPETNMDLVEEVIEEQQKAPTIIGDTDTEEPLAIETRLSQNQKTLMTKPFPKNSWESCKHYKDGGSRSYCKEYLGWCAKEKCQRPKY